MKETRIWFEGEKYSRKFYGTLADIIEKSFDKVDWSKIIKVETKEEK